MTLPSATAASTIPLVDELGALQLHMSRHAYSFPAASSDSEFVVSVLTQIVGKGYAVHGPNALCLAPGTVATCAPSPLP